MVKTMKDLNYFKNRRWDLLFSNGIKLKLPSKKIEDSVKIYKQLLDNDNLINIKTIGQQTYT